MAGQKYAAGGIRSTVAATRAASDEELRARARGFLDEMLAQGTTTVEIKSGYGLSRRRRGTRLVRLAAEVTAEVTFLGAHVVPAEYAGRARRLRRPRRRRDARRPARRTRMDRRVLRDRSVHAWSRADASSRRASRAGLGRACTPASSGPGDGVRLAVELGAASVDHCTYLSDEDVAALAGSNTVATLLPGVEFSTRQPYPDARVACSTPASRWRWPATATRGRASPRRCRSASPSPCATWA